METIFGYGSLMNQNSIMKTSSLYMNFRAAVLPDYLRLYDLVSVASIKNNMSDWSTLEVAALSIAPSKGICVKGCLFEIPCDQMGPYFEREHRYKAIKVHVNDILHNYVTEAWTVVAQTDEEYLEKLDGGEEEWYERVGQYYTGKLRGRTDILPLRKYSNDVIFAALNLGGAEWLDNLMKCTFLSDKVTTLEQYYKRFPDRLSQEIFKV